MKCYKILNMSSKFSNLHKKYILIRDCTQINTLRSSVSISSDITGLEFSDSCAVTNCGQNKI